mgnify:CR=1 FL=1
MDRLEPGAQIVLVAAAREGLAAVRRLLVKASPEALEGCVPHIAAVTANLALLERRLGDGAVAGAEFSRQMGVFAGELRKVAALVGGAGAFHRGLAKLAAAGAGRYGPAANHPPAAPRGRISLEG